MSEKDRKKEIYISGYDKRTRQDIIEELAKKAKSYTPEWNFNPDDPDIGAVIASIFADQSERTIDIVNRVSERYRMAFVNLLDLTRNPVTPAHSIVTMGMISGTIPGVDLPAGTRLTVVSDPGEDFDPVTDNLEPPVYETDKSFHVTGAMVTELFMTDDATGDVIPLLGDFKGQDLLENLSGDTGAQDILPEDEPEPEPAADEFREEIKPFVLFGKQQGIGKNALIIYHRSAFDTQGSEIRLSVDGNDGLMKELCDSDSYSITYNSSDGLREFKSVALSDTKDYIALQPGDEFEPISMDGEDYGALVIESKKPVNGEIAVSSIGLSSEGAPISPVSVFDGNADLNPDNFLPFTDTLSLYADCMIACDNYFRMAGATCTVTFSVSFLENIFDLTTQQIETSLKIIKRRPRAELTPAYADVFIQEIAIEYFNGIGYKKLPTDTQLSTSLEKATAGKLSFSFVVPSDWEPSETGGVEGRAIRFRLIKADNCYMRPSVHHYPRFTDMKISYSYNGQSVSPEKLVRISGTKSKDITKLLASRDAFPIFKRSEYRGDCLYIGLSKRPEAGPVSLFINVEDRMSHLPIPITFEYSSIRGFRRIKVMDYTDSLSRAGIIMFDPPSDFAADELEGKNRFWLRISRDKKKDMSDGASDVYLPVIKDIRMNGMTVTNIEENREDDYFVDSVRPDMTFNLSYSGLVRADIWVNEFGHISRDEMQELMNSDTTPTRPEMDSLGNITAFYVLWQECDDFESAQSRRVYRLDRVNKILSFGNGITTEIPRVADDIAFRIKAYTSLGDKGNVGAHKINGTDGPAMFLDGIDNPVRAYGGEKVESIDRALLRGASIISSRKRMISREDYLSYILANCENIDKCSCVTGKCIDGSGGDDDISFVFLMKDFEDGSLSFHMTSERMKRYIERHCELTVDPQNIHFVEPIYVSLSVNVWAKVSTLEDSFALQNRIREGIREYLNPVSGQGAAGNEMHGWDIGTLPQKSQIMMKLVALKGPAKISKMTVTASWKDNEGEHESDITELETRPYFVPKSGSHSIYIDYE